MTSFVWCCEVGGIQPQLRQDKDLASKVMLNGDIRRRGTTGVSIVSGAPVLPYFINVFRWRYRSRP